MKIGEIDNYNFTKFHQNQMKNKKVLLIARFSVQNFKVSVESWKLYIVKCGIVHFKCKTYTDWEVNNPFLLCMKWIFKEKKVLQKANYITFFPQKFPSLYLFLNSWKSVRNIFENSWLKFWRIWPNFLGALIKLCWFHTNAQWIKNY